MKYIFRIFLLFIVIKHASIYAQTHDTLDRNPNYKKSRNKYLKSISDTLNIGKTHSQQISHQSGDSIVAFSHLKKNEALTTLEGYKKALKLAEDAHNERGITLALSNIGLFYVNTHDFQQALDYYQKCLKIQEGLHDKLGILETANSIGNIYTQQKNQIKAEEYYARSLKLAKELKISEKIKRASNALSKTYATQGNYKNAYEMHQLFKRMTDSIYQQEKHQITKQNQLRNEYNKRHLLDSLQKAINQKTYQKHISEKELEVENTKKITYLISIGLALALLLAFSFYKGYKNTKNANKIIGFQKQEVEDKKHIIEKSLEEKEILLKEIHHRVKNNLQIISSLLNLQANRTEDISLKKIMSEARNRINSMALIHQKIYQSGNLTSVDFQAYIEQMAETIDSTFNTHKKAITYYINTSAIVLDIDTAIPLGLIINELLTNSYKYAFEGRDKGIIRIVLERKNETDIELHVSDNGIGTPQGFDISNSKSLGLKLVKGLADQLKGTFKYDNNGGAHFFVNFKKQILN